MKKILTLFLLSTLITSSIYSQVSTIVPCDTDNYERENIELHLVFDENGNLDKSAIINIPNAIDCNSRHYLVTTIHNKSSEAIEEIVIENLLYTDNSEPTISGGVVPIIIRPIPPKDCIKAISPERINFSHLDNLLTNTSTVNFSIKNKFGNTLSTVQKEFVPVDNIGELELLNVNAKLKYKIDIQWDVINYGCNLKTPFTSNVYASRDSIFDKSDILIAKRKTKLSRNRGSEHIAILHNYYQLGYFKYIIIQIDSDDEIIETNESNNLRVIKIGTDNKSPILAYSRIDNNTINFVYKNDIKTPIKIVIFDQSGIIKTTKSFTKYSNNKNITIELSQLESGIYFYKMITNKNIYSGSLIKQ